MVQNVMQFPKYMRYGLRQIEVWLSTKSINQYSLLNLWHIVVLQAHAALFIRNA